MLRGQAVSRPADPTSEGHELLGWRLNGADVYDFSAPVMGDLILMAWWGRSLSGSGTAEEPYQIGNAEELVVSDVNVKRTKRNTLMATFNLEDLAGSIECICFDYEKVSDVLEEDAVVTVRGKFEVSDRANQLIGYEIEKLELTEEQQNVKPVCMELQVLSNELNALSSSRLLDILKTHPGNDPIVLFVAQTDGSRMRAELPLTINARDHMLKADLHDLFGREIWKAS